MSNNNEKNHPDNWPVHDDIGRKPAGGLPDGLMTKTLADLVQEDRSIDFRGEIQKAVTIIFQEPSYEWEGEGVGLEVPTCPAECVIIEFQAANGDIIGQVVNENGKMAVKGNLKRSAKIFLEYLSGRIKNSKGEKEK